MTILTIDTSTTHGSASLLAEGELRLEETFTADRTTNSALFAVLERAVRALCPAQRSSSSSGSSTFFSVSSWRCMATVTV